MSSPPPIPNAEKLSFLTRLKHALFKELYHHLSRLGPRLPVGSTAQNSLLLAPHSSGTHAHPEVQACKHRNFHKESSDQQVARHEEGFCKAKCLNRSWGWGLEEGLKFTLGHWRRAVGQVKVLKMKSWGTLVLVFLHCPALQKRRPNCGIVDGTHGARGRGAAPQPPPDDPRGCHKPGPGFSTRTS